VPRALLQLDYFLKIKKLGNNAVSAGTGGDRRARTGRLNEAEAASADRPAEVCRLNTGEIVKPAGAAAAAADETTPATGNYAAILVSTDGGRQPVVMATDRGIARPLCSGCCVVEEARLSSSSSSSTVPADACDQPLPVAAFVTVSDYSVRFRGLILSLRNMTI